MTIAQEFTEAIQADRAEEDSFKPLLEKFAELKEVLQSNFKRKETKRTWYGKVKNTINNVISIDIDDKIVHSSGKYLYIRINGGGYVMGLGEVGELKDKLYFIESSMFISSRSKDKTVVYITSGMFGVYDHCLEDKITNVQLFAHLIKRYKIFLVTK
jgi:hypothetical protein